VPPPFTPLPIISFSNAMETLPAKLTWNALWDLAHSYLPQDLSTDATLELIISIDDENINVRELSAYLSLIDRIYGRLSPKGLNSYAHKESGQLEIGELRKGSLELVISEAASHFREVAVLIVLWQVLKQLPNIAAAFKDYQEAMLARQNRKRIKQEMQREESLQRLDKKRLNELVTVVNTLLTTEHKHLNAPIRFAQTRVKFVTIKVKEKKLPDPITPDTRKIVFDDEL